MSEYTAHDFDQADIAIHRNISYAVTRTVETGEWSLGWTSEQLAESEVYIPVWLADLDNLPRNPYSPEALLRKMGEREEPRPGCPFCDRWLRGEFERCGSYPSMPVIRFEPLNPVTPGHMLFLPASHQEHPAPEAVGECVKRAAEYAEEQGGDFNLITSSGSAATQTIQHVHVHYVPRLDDDGLTLPWTGQERQRSTDLGLEGDDDE